MFKSVRFRLTLWFVLLSLIAYLLTTAATGILFHHQLTRAIDAELTELLAENFQNVDYDNGRLFFTRSDQAAVEHPTGMLASIQLYDADGRVIQQSGAFGVAKLFQDTIELPFHRHHLRSKSKAFLDKGKVIGYLQIQLPTDQRERAENEIMLMLIVTAPILVCLLAGAGYYFTMLTTRPVEQAFSILRDFTTNAGHELKTPLSVAQAVLENLNRAGAHKPDIDKKLAIIELSVTRMRNLIDDMILLAKFDSEKALEPVLTIIPLHDLVGEVIKQVQPLADEHHFSTNITSLAKVWVRGNQLQLEQMIMNVLHNAVAYNKPGGTVSIDLTASTNKAVLTISDTGIGITQENLNKVFDRFYRVEDSRSRETGGSGLGLSIVKAVIEAHQGTVDIQSQLDHGTKVIMTLPAVSFSDSAELTDPHNPHRPRVI